MTDNEQHLSRQKSESLTLLSCMIVMLSVYIFLYGYAVMDWDWRISAENLTYIAEGLGLVLCLFFVLRFRLSFRDLGLSLSHLKQGWKLLLIYLVCVVGGLIALRYILLAMDSPLVSRSEFLGWRMFVYVSPLTSLYPEEVILQEFLARCVMQESLLNLYSGPLRQYWTITITSLLFGALHLAYGFVFMCSAAGMMALFSLYYSRTHNLAGTIVLHYVMSAAALMLGLR